MNAKLKQRQIDRLREDRFTRDFCPGVRTEDWILACLYRHPIEFMFQIVAVKPEYMRTAPGQALCAKLHEYEEGKAPKLKELDCIYRTQVQALPERAQELQSIRDHIARLRRIPWSKTSRSGWAREIVRDWCEDRRKALHPNRKLATEELKRAFVQANKELVQARQEINKHNKVREALRTAELDRASAVRDLLEELRLRTDGHIDTEQARKALLASCEEGGLRQRLLRRILLPIDEEADGILEE
jgi:hypothetical protein